MSSNSQYFESKVLTAPPQRLHLMLIEGAIRFGRDAELAMQRNDSLAASTPLMRMLDILGDLLAGIRERKTELNEKIAGFYTYLFRIVAQAKVNDDVSKLSEALKLLEFECETWQLVCAKIGNGPAPEILSPSAAGSAITQQRPNIFPSLGNSLPATSAGISLEA
jgi:flagellar protein FliS